MYKGDITEKKYRVFAEAYLRKEFSISEIAESTKISSEEIQRLLDSRTDIFQFSETYSILPRRKRVLKEELASISEAIPEARKEDVSIKRAAEFTSIRISLDRAKKKLKKELPEIADENNKAEIIDEAWGLINDARARVTQLQKAGQIDSKTFILLEGKLKKAEERFVEAVSAIDPSKLCPDPATYEQRVSQGKKSHQFQTGRPRT